jgi:cellulose synthase operon protein YhjQ
MTDRGPLYDQNDTPEDVATLYSWANLHGAKYRDFSEARAQTREKARQRVQQAIEEEQARLQKQEQAERAADMQREAEARRLEEQERQAEWAAQQAAQVAEQHAAKQAAAQRAAELAAAELAAAELAAAELAEEQAQASRKAAEQLPESQQPPKQPAWQPMADRFAAFVAQESAPPRQQQVSPQREYPDYAHHAEPVYGPTTAMPNWPGTAPAQPAAARESYEPPQRSWSPIASGQPEPREIPSRPAWLTPEKPEAPGSAHARPAEDTLQGTRDRLASRWYALRGVIDGISTQPDTAPAAPPTRTPVVAVFSLAGGVGKTSLAATLGRALSGRGERVLLVDTAPYGLMPFFFGAHDQRPGVLRTFSPPGTSGDAPIQLVTIDPESLGPETSAQDVLSSEITKYSRSGVSRVIVDLATASGATTRRVLRMSPLVLVPMLPDMNSLVSVSSIDSFFQHNVNANSKQVMPFYILNQFDSSLPLHLDIREILREQLGDRLLTLALHRTPAVSEALAEGMTVMDYAPNSTVAEDFADLAGWVKSQSAPASSAYRGVRWSER